uniref:Uncharacterized protein n=1 Tax=Romanomermis culicivorax TaxID=13658 RepID=A0A915KPB3_ROMCU
MPLELRNKSLNNLTRSDFDLQKCSTVDSGAKIAPRNRQPSYPKLFFSLAMVLFIATTISLLWIWVWKRRKTVQADPVQAAKMKSKMKVEPYAYRNLVMMQEDMERQERTTETATEREDPFMNVACLALEKTSVV